MEPDFFNTQLDLLERVVFHNFSNKLGVNVLVGVRSGSGSDLIEEFAEIQAYWQIDEHTLIEACIIVTLDRLDVFHLREVTERVGGAHKLLNSALTLQTLDYEHDVLDLVAMEHHLEESVQGVN